jgi:hypothetical protein
MGSLSSMRSMRYSVAWMQRRGATPQPRPRVFGRGSAWPAAWRLRSDLADREAVLAAVRTHSPRVPLEVADAAGALVVTPAFCL